MEKYFAWSAEEQGATVAPNVDLFVWSVCEACMLEQVLDSLVAFTLGENASKALLMQAEKLSLNFDHFTKCHVLIVALDFKG